jgi:hypothetical protein
MNNKKDFDSDLRKGKSDEMRRDIARAAIGAQQVA